MRGKTLRVQVLLVSNDPVVEEQVRSLGENDFEIHHHPSITKAGAALHHTPPPQIILIDTENSRELAALEFCYFIKSNPNFIHSRIFILSSHPEEFAEVAAFDAGADDFIRKPLKVKSLARRILARLDKGGKDILIQGENPGTSSVKIDPESYSVYLGAHAVHVSRKEFELLYLMASRPGKIFNRNELYEQVWKKKYSLRDRTIDVHILRLRRKLGKDFIQTQKGVGYRFSSS
jgi:two-component system alkaline phosphatase synthesis response regulator PhoP